MTASEFSFYLAQTETRNTAPNLPDGGRAFGRWQVHADWFSDHVKRYELWAELGETWDHWISRVVHAFAEEYLPTDPPAELAMYFHKGHRVAPADPDWDPEYAKRFADFSDQVKGSRLFAKT